jgi:NAD(P)-dependent dehydrogenase (short-subunit alcohol dehydrogenase family)
MKLSGKVAVVTGGNSGIGLAAAKLYLKEGAMVVITGRNALANDKALQELKAVSPKVFAFVSDAGKLGDVHSLPKLIAEKVAPKIDILFLNAGIAKFQPIDIVSEEMYDETFDINTKGVFFGIQQFLPFINDGGTIILNTTVAYSLGMPGSNVYAASKAAILSFAKSVSAEVIHRGIRVNAISPGPINTPLYLPEKMGMPSEAIQQMAGGILARTPMNRFGAPEEVAKVALFLASDDSSYIVGEEILVDGGFGTMNRI